MIAITYWIQIRILATINVRRMNFGEEVRYKNSINNVATKTGIDKISMSQFFYTVRATMFNCKLLLYLILVWLKKHYVQFYQWIHFNYFYWLCEIAFLLQYFTNLMFLKRQFRINWIKWYYFNLFKLILRYLLLMEHASTRSIYKNNGTDSVNEYLFVSHGKYVVCLL